MAIKSEFEALFAGRTPSTDPALHQAWRMATEAHRTGHVTFLAYLTAESAAAHAQALEINGYPVRRVGSGLRIARL